MATTKIGARPFVETSGSPKIEDVKVFAGALLSTGAVKTVSLSEDGQIGVAGPCIYYGYLVTTALSAAVCNVRDATTAGTGTIVDIIAASSAAGVKNLIPFGVYCANGCFANFAGTGTVTFYYQQI